MEVQNIKSDKFWDDFVNNIWQKEYAVLDAYVQPDIITHEDAYQMLLNGLNTFTRKRHASKASLKLFIDGTPVTPAEIDAMGIIPKISDGNYTNFIERLQPLLKGRELCTVLDRAELLPHVRAEVYGLLKNVFSRLGYIAPESFAFFFFGEYTSTPFGAHIHDCEKECDATFITSLRGEKTIWVWPEGYEEDNPEVNGMRDMEAYSKDAAILIAHPGQMIYFPSYQLHIGESKVKDSFNLFVAVKPARDCTSAFFNFIEKQLECFPAGEYQEKYRILSLLRDRYEQTVKHLKQKERDNSRLQFDPDNMQKNAESIPEHITDAAKLLANYIPQDFLDLMAVKFWVSVLSSYGLASEVIEIEEAPLMKNQSIQLLKNHSLLWGKSTNHIVVGCAGTTFDYNKHHEDLVKPIVELINTGNVISIESMTNQFADLRIQDEIMHLLNRLNHIGVLKLTV
ncbi:hypothetical protein KIH87_10600 [Paraneptunicella aestuarii]|uniref:hypothetical protein n=1 Tax=Paraneptunicella aestuarii TaxID=2831148 RepID=UPI001E37FDD0|nr:hypothetical protein [Paraneptunicella aestuarii]UAA37198.1 hypothetical protein KIH87_10600 [Paraneptunicella aestuarii]